MLYVAVRGENEVYLCTVYKVTLCACKLEYNDDVRMIEDNSQWRYCDERLNVYNKFKILVFITIFYS